MARNFRRDVAQVMIDHIEAGTAPWQKPWKPGVIRTGAYNPATGKSYRGINAWWLDMQGFSDPRWLTYRQASGLDAQVRKGERANMVEYWQWTKTEPVLDADGKPVLDDDGNKKMATYRLERPRVFHAYVFNAEQIDGLVPLVLPEPSFAPHEQAEKVLAGAGIPIHHDQSDRAFYRPSTDAIHLPYRAAFPEAYEYYATALHEIGHATGHPSRLNREFGPFGSETYAKEELRAEMASFMMTTEIGLGHYPERHANYVESWLKALKNDHNLLFQAARDADIARTWVMEPEQRPTLERQAVKHLENAQTPVPDKLAVKSDVLLHQQQPAATTEPMARVYLDVPFAEREQAKADGARWDKAAKSWYAPDGIDGASLERLLENWPAKDNAPGEAQDLTPAPSHDVPERPVMEKRTYLAVPYAEKNQAKALGARWDKGKKSWYAPPGADLDRLKTWLPKPEMEHAREAATDPLREFADALKENGLVLDGPPVMDGRWHRVPVDDDPKGKKSGSYRGFADGVPNGQIMNYKNGQDAVQWTATGHKIDPAEIERLKAESAARLAVKAQELAEQHRRVAKRAYGMFMNAADAPVDHPYLVKKGVAADGLKVDDKGNLLVPARDEKDFLWNLQIIKPDGTKRFLKDGRKEGLMHRMGSGDGPVLVAEGYATAASLKEVTGHRVAVAFDAGNLVKVAEALHRNEPKTPLVFAADDDHAKEINAGLAGAKRAAEAVNGKMIVPAFTNAEKARGLTDYNDLIAERGSDAGYKAVQDDLAAVLGQPKGQAKNRPRVKTQTKSSAPAMAL